MPAIFSPAEPTERIANDLRVLGAETASLPEVAAYWADEPEVNRDVYYLEWRSLMDALTTLEGDYRSGVMSVDQQSAYRTLLGRLKGLAPLFTRLDLPLPSVPLDP